MRGSIYLVPKIFANFCFVPYKVSLIKHTECIETRLWSEIFMTRASRKWHRSALLSSSPDPNIHVLFLERLPHDIARDNRGYKKAAIYWHIRFFLCYQLIHGISRRPFPGLVNFVPAVAYIICLILHAAFSQLANSLIEIPCINPSLTNVRNLYTLSMFYKGQAIRDTIKD